MTTKRKSTISIKKKATISDGLTVTSGASDLDEEQDTVQELSLIDLQTRNYMDINSNRR